MKLAQIREGKTDLVVPKQAMAHSKGPGTYKTGVFFNPVMEFSRDVSILVLRGFAPEKRTKLLDGLAGTGARGVRICNEVTGDLEIVINDHNPKAFELIEKNIALNELTNCGARNQKMNTLLSQEDFDYVDIDPFGSPVQFIDSSLQAIRNTGMIALTATDTAPLCGTYPKTCLRRYGAKSIKTEYSKEIGARILAGHCVRLGAKYDIALKPILVFFIDHYIRAHFEVKKGAKRADSALQNVGYLVHNHKTKERLVTKEIPEKIGEAQLAGPLWIGNLHEKKVLKNMELDNTLGSTKRLGKFLDMWIKEADSLPFFFDLNEIASITKTQPLSIHGMIEELRENGFSAARTHFSPTGFKTDAGIFEISRLLGKRA